jgi:predicted SAM-dependent methyltransferase
MFLFDEIPQNSKIAIYGSGELGIGLKNELIEKRKDVYISFFIDTFASGEINGYKIFNIEEAKEKKAEFSLIVITSMAHADKIKDILIKNNFKNFIDINDLFQPYKPDKDEKIKLHLGCGTIYKEGWVNIDNNSDNNVKWLDINHDLRYPLPFEDNSVDFIFNEHFLEHLTIEEGVNALKDFYRVLKPSGVLRVAMPDLEEIIKQYLDPNWKKQEWIKVYNMGFVQTKAELININFRWWGHQHLYDAEELERRLRESGFENIKSCKLRKSEITELNNLETRDESTLIAEATK